MKKVAMKMPVTKADPMEAWVKQKTADVPEGKIEGQVIALHEPAEAMKRFTIDVTESLHKRIKTQCAMRGTKMADIIRELLEREFPEQAS
jgi:predicted DNA binding CopG/RHH family protein